MQVGCFANQKIKLTFTYDWFTQPKLRGKVEVKGRVKRQFFSQKSSIAKRLSMFIVNKFSVFKRQGKLKYFVFVLKFGI